MIRPDIKYVPHFLLRLVAFAAPLFGNVVVLVLFGMSASVLLTMLLMVLCSVPMYVMLREEAEQYRRLAARVLSDTFEKELMRQNLSLVDELSKHESD